jgi:hypothetical protein
MIHVVLGLHVYVADPNVPRVIARDQEFVGEEIGE